MSRQGRSHRGRRGRKKQASENGDPAHRQKVQRRKESRARRQALTNQIIEAVTPHLEFSKCGLAVSTNGTSKWGVYYASKDAWVDVRQVPGGVCSSTRTRPVVVDRMKWPEVSESMLALMAQRVNWEPYKPKTALEWLAEAAV